MAQMDMDHQYYDDQIFSDLGGSMKQSPKNYTGVTHDTGMKQLPVKTHTTQVVK